METEKHNGPGTHPVLNLARVRLKLDCKQAAVLTTRRRVAPKNRLALRLDAILEPD